MALEAVMNHGRRLSWIHFRMIGRRLELLPLALARGSSSSSLFWGPIYVCDLHVKVAVSEEGFYL